MIAPIQSHFPEDPPPRRGRWGRDRTRGPNGRWNCFCGCGREVVPPRRTTFSQECLDAWQARNDPPTIRRIILARDRAICAHCQMDCRSTVEVFRYPERPDAWELAEIIRWEQEGWRRRPGQDYSQVAHRAAEQAQIFHQSSNHEMSWLAHQRDRDLQARGFVTQQSLWEADHIVPVAEGGGQCGPEGYRTLCQVCHRIETARLATRRAQRRRQGRQPEFQS